MLLTAFSPLMVAFATPLGYLASDGRVDKAANSTGYPAKLESYSNPVANEVSKPATTGARKWPINGFSGLWDRSNHGYGDGAAVVGDFVAPAWKDLNPDVDKYDFSKFDSLVHHSLSKGRGLSWMIYTGSGYVPEWIYSHGVSKVKVDGKKVPGDNGHWPCYTDAAYEKYFFGFHAALKDHIAHTFKANLTAFTGIDMTFGSTGDVTPWHGTPNRCKIDTDSWWTDSTVRMAKIYNDWLGDPSMDFYLITRGTEKFSAALRKQIIDAVPRNHWVETDHLYCKTYMLNGEKKALTMEDTTFALTHTEKDGQYVLSQCFQDQALPHTRRRLGLTESNIPLSFEGVDLAVSVWQTIVWMLTWGQDRVASMYIDGVETHGVKGSAREDKLWMFFNRYCGGRATNAKQFAGAWASLRHGLDASDTESFPDIANDQDGDGKGGNACLKVVAKYAHMGAKQDDKSIDPGSVMDGRTRHGMNDCGWDISPDNYHMYLKQIDAEKTSVGMWRVGDFESGKPGQYFGRFARSFQHSKGMNDMYFAVTGGVFDREDLVGSTDPAALNMRVVYYDKGNGSFSVKYGSSCQEEQKFTKKNSGDWKEATMTLSPSGLAKACKSNSDFALHNTDAEDDVFAFVEVSAEPLTPLITI